MSAPLAFGLFVSCVEGQPVSRFGSAVLVGAQRDPAQTNRITYNPELIVAIPEAEFNRYRREYTQLVAEGALIERTEAEWLEQETAPPPTPEPAQPGQE